MFEGIIEAPRNGGFTMLILVGLVTLIFGLYLLAKHYGFMDQIVEMGTEFFKLINSLDSPFTIGILCFIFGIALVLAGVIAKTFRGEKNTPKT